VRAASDRAAWCSAHIASTPCARSLVVEWARDLLRSKTSTVSGAEGIIVEQQSAPDFATSAPRPAALSTLVAQLFDEQVSARAEPCARRGAPEEWRRRKSELDAVLRSLDG
jgi:hypothetical protein